MEFQYGVNPQLDKKGEVLHRSQMKGQKDFFIYVLGTFLIARAIRLFLRHDGHEEKSLQ